MTLDFDRKISSAALKGPRAWRGMFRAESRGGNPDDVTKAIQFYQPEKLIYAEGDSWFDKFTPIPLVGTNLLAAIRLPFATVVADVSHIGDEADRMVHGQQARQTRAMFNLHRFDAILLSAGGNDLKNIFTEMFEKRSEKHGSSTWSTQELADLKNPENYSKSLKAIAANIRTFVEMRDKGRQTAPTKPPLFFHTYDYLQPRPAGAMIFANTRIGRGPWLSPAMRKAGLTVEQMRSSVDAVIDQLHESLKAIASAYENVHLIDQRGLLTPAGPKSEGSDADWFDEIHPNESGFRKLASERWEVPLAQALGWRAESGDELIAAATASNPSTAVRA